MRSRCQLFRFDGVEGITSDVTNMGLEKAAEALAREVMRIISDVVKQWKWKVPRSSAPAYPKIVGRFD